MNSGNIGIGTNSPGEKLSIVSNTFSAIMSLNSSGSNTLMDLNNSGTNPANWSFGYLGNTGVSPGYMTFLNGSHRFVVTNNGDVGIAVTNPQARLEMTSSGNSSASHALLINNSNPTNIFAIRDDGNVGIGTASPGQNLHVLGDVLINNISAGNGFGANVTNTRFGEQSFSALSTGGWNTAVGYIA